MLSRDKILGNEEEPDWLPRYSVVRVVDSDDYTTDAMNHLRYRVGVVYLTPGCSEYAKRRNIYLVIFPENIDFKNNASWESWWYKRSSLSMSAVSIDTAFEYSVKAREYIFVLGGKEDLSVM